MSSRLWRASAPLTVTAAAMIPVLVGAAIGLVIDDRVITAVPAWLKPAKFALSIAIYTVTLAWILSLLPGWRKTRRIVGWTTAVTMVVEMLLIAMQAWRGVPSHFNVATPFDAAVFATMGTAIVVQTLSAMVLAVAVWREPHADRALGWALRAGVTLSILGALTGGLMTRPTEQQLRSARMGTPLVTAGAHTVGGADGGPGLPGVGWSTAHGDLRVPHFVGLHALQALPLLAIALKRRRVPDAVRARVIVVAGLSYASLFAILLAGALGGQPMLTPDPVIGILLVAWASITAVALAGTRRTALAADPVVA